MTAVGLVTLYGFVTFEQTAIATVPTAETVVAFIPATPTPTPTPSPTPVPTPTVAGQEVQAVASGNAPLISHPIDGREDCLECHAGNGPLPYPPNHEGWPVSTCTVCHATDGENPPPPAIQHKIKGREDCLKCHELDTLPDSHQAGNFTNENCTICHAPKNKEVAQNEAKSTPTPADEGAVNESEETSSKESTASESEASASVGNITFAKDILPLFEGKCKTCHIKTAKGDLSLSSYESLMKGSASGPVVVPGSPDESLLVQIMQDDHPRQLEGQDLQKLMAWIAAGASAEEGAANEAKATPTPEDDE
jgi:hypothetical protein